MGEGPASVPCRWQNMHLFNLSHASNTCIKHCSAPAMHQTGMAACFGVAQCVGCRFCCSLCSRGEKFDRQRHECGTEVKAITYSAMQIREAQGDAEVFVIVDI